MTKRKRIPQDIEEKVLTLSGRRCCLCFGIKLDYETKKGQIAHLDQNPENNDFDNLAWFCLDHHDEYDSRTSQSKGMTIGEVKKYRTNLYEVVEKHRADIATTSETSSSRGTLYVLGESFVIVALVVLMSLVIWYLIIKPQSRDITCNEPVRTATATIEITIASDEALNTTYMDRGAYMVFGKGNEPILTMSSTQSTAKQIGDGQVVYRAVTNMDVADSAFGNPMHLLEEAEYIQISFLPMPQESQILSGKVTAIFNGRTVLEMNIPMQETSNGLIFVRGLGLTCGATP